MLYNFCSEKLKEKKTGGGIECLSKKIKKKKEKQMSWKWNPLQFSNVLLVSKFSYPYTSVMASWIFLTHYYGELDER